MTLKNLWRRKVRTFLTVFGIAIGVAAVVALGAMATNIVDSYGSMINNPNADITVSQKDAIDISYSALDEELGDRLRAVPDVEVVDPVVIGWVTGENMPFFMVFGYEPNSLAIRRFQLTEGKPVSGPRQMILGSQAAQDLKKGVGDTLRIYSTPYQIVGIYETGQAMEEGGGVVALSEAQEIAKKPRQVNAFQIKLRRPERVDATVERMRPLFPDLSVSKGSGNDAIQEWSGMIDAMAWGIAAIAIIVGGLGMMNTMIMSVFERTREIGVSRALGWSQRRVMGLILGEALALSFIGGAVGIGLGILLTEGAARIPGLGGMLAGGYSPILFAQGMVTALLLGTVGGIYPAWWASRLTPVEALRYEGGASAKRPAHHAGAAEESGQRLRLPQTLRDLGRRRIRTLLTVLGIGVGVAALVALNGISAGMINQLNQLAGGSAIGDLTIMQRDIPDMSLSTIDERMGRAIANMPEVESVSGMMLGFTSLKGMPFFIITGIEPNEPPMRHYAIVEGGGIRRPNEILIGRTAAEAIKVGVGNTLQLLNNTYRIVGIFETGVAWEEAGVVLAMREAQTLLNRPRQVSYYLVDVRNPDDTEFVREAIERRFDDLKVSVSSEFAQNTNDIQSMKAMTGAVILMALILGGIVIMNTMVMTIYERTREIGTLRALGWRQRRILGLVVREAVMLSSLAGLTGIVIGVSLTEMIGAVPAASYLKGAYDIGMFLETLLIAVILGVIGGFYPAWRASRLSPVEALRYE